MLDGSDAILERARPLKPAECERRGRGAVTDTLDELAKATNHEGTSDQHFGE